MSSKGENRFDSTEASPWMRPFVPRRFLRNGHLQTIVGLLLPRADSLPEPESQLIEVEAATSARGASFVLCHCHWQPAEVRSERLTMVLVHGLEGSSCSPYVLGNTARAWTAGCNVVRMNMRSCGAGEQLSPSIYHAGRSEDVAIVMAELARTHLIRSFALVGYSMGGNLVLKLAGELGGGPPSYLKAAVGVSPSMDLDCLRRRTARSAEPPLREQVSRRPTKALSPQGRTLPRSLLRRRPQQDSDHAPIR